MVGVTDDRLGEVPKAFIVKRKDVDVTKDELIEFYRSKLAKYKAIRDVEFIDALPKTSTGKLLRRALKQLATKSELWT